MVGPHDQMICMQPLSKRIPENPKYKHIKATVDTGKPRMNCSSCWQSAFSLDIHEKKGKTKIPEQSVKKSTALDGIGTHNTAFYVLVLYQLSYQGSSAG